MTSALTGRDTEIHPKWFLAMLLFSKFCQFETLDQLEGKRITRKHTQFNSPVIQLSVCSIET